MSTSIPDLVIEPGRVERQYWRDLWHYRELFYFLAWRDILVRYKQTVIGLLWAILRPLLSTVVMVVVFGKVANLEAAESVPYPILVFAGMLPWQFFASSLAESSNSLIGSSNLISKIYFPRLIVPASSVITSFVDFLICFVFLVGFMVWYQFVPDWRILALPLFIAMAFAAATGAGLWFASLNVKYRDVRFIVPFIVQFGLYVSPVGFSSAQFLKRFGEEWQFVYSLNPMVGVIDGFRWAILGGDIYLPGFAASLGVVLALLTSGVWFFRKMERTFADVI